MDGGEEDVAHPRGQAPRFRRPGRSRPRRARLDARGLDRRCVGGADRPGEDGRPRIGLSRGFRRPRRAPGPNRRRRRSVCRRRRSAPSPAGRGQEEHRLLRPDSRAVHGHAPLESARSGRRADRAARSGGSGCRRPQAGRRDSPGSQRGAGGAAGRCRPAARPQRSRRRRRPLLD